MLPAVALVGRPNVGKSTLFNRLTATRDALVADYPGLTRDRRYGVGRAADRKFIVVDTGGLVSGSADAMATLVAEQVEIKTKYAGYIDRQQDEIARLRASEDIRLPADLDYATISGLSKEIQHKLSSSRPETLGQAGRIPGVTPAAISLLLIHLKKRGAGRQLEQSA